MRSRLHWFLSLGGLLLLAALLTIFMGVVSAPPLSGSLFHFWEDAAEPLHVLLAPPLILLALVLLARFCRDSGPQLLSKGELDWLIQRKQQGALLHRSQRIRESAARVSRCSPSTSRTARAGRAPLTAPEEVLDRLVQLKRHGAWRRST
jgi:hypothetical protein